MNDVPLCDEYRESLIVAAMTATHPVEPPPGLDHSFSEPDLAALAATRRVSVIAHHGAFVSVRGFELHSAYRELALVFSHVSGPDDVASRWLSSNANARAVPGQVNVLLHGAPLNRRVAEHMIAVHAQSFLHASPAQFFDSYDSLACACVTQRNSVALGLRGAAAADPLLKVVSVDGVHPCEPAAQRSYPLQYLVQLYVARHQSLAELDQTARILDRIRQRHAEDQSSVFARARAQAAVRSRLSASAAAGP